MRTTSAAACADRPSVVSLLGNRPPPVSATVPEGARAPPEGGYVASLALDMTSSDPSGRRVPPHHDPACWGCGDASGGIRLALPEREGTETYESRVRFDERHQAGPGLVHGGLVGAALDEACGLLATWYRFPAVTARIFVRYRRPVPINSELVVRARVEATRGRRIHVAGELVGDGGTLADARAAFLHVPLEHFLATPEGRAAGAAWRRRLGVP